MRYENFNEEEINPRDIEDTGTSSERKPEEENENEEEGYDILPSNGPGLGGDDGEQVVDDYEEEEEDEDDE